MPLAASQEAPPPEPGKTQREQVRQEVDEAVDAIRDYSADRRDEAVARARESAEDADRRIDALEAQMGPRWNAMSDAARTRSQQAMTELRQRRNELSEWYGGMRHGSEAAWSEVRAGFVKSYHDLEEAMRRARGEFEEEQEKEPEPEQVPPKEPQPSSMRAAYPDRNRVD
jgi:hypothetical protein